MTKPGVFKWPNSWDMAMFIPFMKWIFELGLCHLSQDQDGHSGAPLPSYSTPPYREVWWSRGGIFSATDCISDCPNLRKRFMNTRKVSVQKMPSRTVSPASFPRFHVSSSSHKPWTHLTPKPFGIYPGDSGGFMCTPRATTGPSFSKIGRNRVHTFFVMIADAWFSHANYS